MNTRGCQNNNTEHDGTYRTHKYFYRPYRNVSPHSNTCKQVFSMIPKNAKILMSDLRTPMPVITCLETPTKHLTKGKLYYIIESVEWEIDKTTLEKTMIVYLSGKQIVIETNLAWAIPYWAKRRANNKNITWKLK